VGVELLEGMLGPRGHYFLPNSEYRSVVLGSQSAGVSSVRRKGNNPDHRLRSLNRISVVKEVRWPRHPEGRLRSSHPWKSA